MRNRSGLRAVVSLVLLVGAAVTGLAVMLFPAAAIALGALALFLLMLGVVIIPTRRRQ